jgi:hypothetical protein
MFRRKAWQFLMGVLAIGFQVFVAGTASAHTLTVTATASCLSGSAVISYTATSWDQNPADTGGTNPEIDILFNGVQVDAQPFLSNTTPPNQFSGQMPAPLGTNTVIVEAVAAAKWGDGFASGQTSEVTVTVPTDCAPGTGRFTGGGKQVIGGGVTITKGFEVDCDLHQPSNNLEINWKDAAGAHQFHMETFDSAACSLPGNPVPPKAPVNKIVASGTGRFDGADGYTVQFTLIDNGEPGAGVDEAGFKVFLTAAPNTVVLLFPLDFITTGNIQAHVDQK